MNGPVNRRNVLQTAAGLAGGLFLTRGELAALGQEPAKSRGNLKQSVCRWCYGKIPLEQMAAEAKKIGYRSIELLSTAEYQVVKPLGLTCAMIRCASITEGLNRPANHDRIEKELTDHIEFAAAEGLPNVICMSGNRKDRSGQAISDEEGLDHCVAGLKRVIGLAERKKVNIVMEGLNSKVNHKDYMYDRTAWGVALCRKLGSPRFKLLYDIYHMQIMEGDVIATLRANQEWIGHIHTGGVPGRNEIDDSQELNYPAIMKALLDLNYDGFVGQEFIPRREPLASLAQGFRICDV